MGKARGVAVGLLLLAAGNAFVPATGRSLSYRVLVMTALVVAAVQLLAIWEPWQPETPRRVAALAALAIAIWAVGLSILPFAVDVQGTPMDCRSAIVSAFEREAHFPDTGPRFPVLFPSSCRDPARTRLVTSAVLLGVAAAAGCAAHMLNARDVRTAMDA